jgi:acyl-CoA thioester hydrolase
MPIQFAHEFDVPPEAIDINRHVNNVEYVRWMQDIAVAHFDSVGGRAVTSAAGTLWVARSHTIEYLKPAVLGDRLRVVTWVEGFRRVSSVRKYEFIRGADGVVVARGQTEWVYVDSETGRPRSIPADLQALFVESTPT